MDSIELSSLLPPQPSSGRSKATLRDPLGSPERYERGFGAYQMDWADDVYCRHIVEELKKLEKGEESRADSYAGNNIGAIVERLVYWYASGVALHALVDRLRVDLPYLLALKRVYYKVRFGLGVASADSRGLYGTWQRESLQRMTFPLLLASDRDQLKAWMSLYDQDADQRLQHPDERSYYSDVLIKAFLPTWSVVKNDHTLPRRGRPGERYEVMQALFRALAQPTIEARSHAMAEYMSQWNRLMRRYGWKPRRVFHPLRPDGSEPREPRSDRLFIEFAFEAALAVCAYDLDDMAFRDHPYYPRDLVDYYRAHIRHSRDAWREQGVGAAVPLEAPSLPCKVDLSTSRSTGIVRWVEIVGDGDADVTEAVVTEVGEVESYDESSLFYELAQNHAGFCVDIKDDDTLAVQVDDLLAARSLEGFDVDGVSGAGPGRCVTMLQALDRWLASTAYRLVALHDDGDAWVGVLVPVAHHVEFAALSRALGIQTFEPLLAFRE